MTKKQRDMVEWLRGQIIYHDGNGQSDKYEYKMFEVKQITPQAVSVHAIVGLKGDESTFAIFARVRRHIFVGPRGGLELANAKRKPCRGRRVVFALTK